MPKLHELLAAQKTIAESAATVVKDAETKFGKPEFFQGRIKTLKMIEDTPANAVAESSAREETPVRTTVFDTLNYALGLWAKNEDLQANKNATNCVAFADIEFRGAVLIPKVAAVTIIALEERLRYVKNLFLAVPTLDASEEWEKDEDSGSCIYRAKNPRKATKTETNLVPVILYPATDKHPAQVKESSKVLVVGEFTTLLRSGAVTAQQKADGINLVNELLVEVRKAKTRANDTEVVRAEIGQKLLDLLLKPFE